MGMWGNKMRSMEWMIVDQEPVSAVDDSNCML